MVKWAVVVEYKLGGSVFYYTWRVAKPIALLVRMEVASLLPDHLPTLSIAKASDLSLLVFSPLVAERMMPALLLDFCFSVPAILK